MREYRMAAIKLHNMATIDQQWLLKRLPAIDCEKLNSYLSELGQLKIESSDLSFEYQSSNDSPTTTAEPHIVMIDRLSGNTAYMLLKGESDFIIATILTSFSWQWKNEFLIECGPERSSRVMRLFAETKNITSACRTILLKKFSETVTVPVKNHSQSHSEASWSLRERIIQFLARGKKWLP